MNNKNSYIKRQQEWRDISVNQLSNANNIILSLSSGLFIFILEKNSISQIQIDLKQDINWQIIFYILSLISLLFSLISGICVLISRLYDFRLSRHIAIVRLRNLKKNKTELSYTDIEPNNLKKSIFSFIRILFIKIHFIKDVDFENTESLEQKFQTIRTLSFHLGNLTWICTKIQVITFMFGGFFYFAFKLLKI